MGLHSTAVMCSIGFLVDKVTGSFCPVNYDSMTDRSGIFDQLGSRQLLRDCCAPWRLLCAHCSV
jgi:hypothetical protein